MQARRQGGGLGGLQPPQFLADQLTLSQPGGTHYPHPVLPAPPDFQTLRRPCVVLTIMVFVLLSKAAQLCLMLMVMMKKVFAGNDDVLTSNQSEKVLTICLK